MLLRNNKTGKTHIAHLAKWKTHYNTLCGSVHDVESVLEKDEFIESEKRTFVMVKKRISDVVNCSTCKKIYDARMVK